MSKPLDEDFLAMLKGLKGGSGYDAEKKKWIAVARTPYEEKVAEIVFEKLYRRGFKKNVFEPTKHIKEESTPGVPREWQARNMKPGEPVFFEINLGDPFDGDSAEIIQDLCDKLNKQGDRFHVEVSGTDGSTYPPEDNPKIVNKAKPEPESEPTAPFDIGEHLKKYFTIYATVVLILFFYFLY